jgi:hypothetical protein
MPVALVERLRPEPTSRRLLPSDTTGELIQAAHVRDAA